MEFLGVVEGDTEVVITYHQEPIRTDVSGPMAMHDLQIMGQEATVGGLFSCYDEKILKKLISAFPSKLGIPQAQIPGFTPSQGLGSLMVEEQNSIRYLVYCPYNTKSVFAGNDAMIKAFNFPTAWPTGAARIATGTRYKRNQISIQAINNWIVNNSGASGVLWNEDFTGLPNISIKLPPAP
jgi:hypothetical protein